MTPQVQAVSDITIYVFFVYVSIGLVVFMIELARDGKFLSIAIAEFSDSNALWLPYAVTAIVSIGAWVIIILWNLIGES